jgi:hypothetical protein
VIIKGGSTSGAGRVAAHVLDGRENEQVEVKELRGVMAGDLHAALREMETAAQCAATRKPLYHASVNPRAGEKLTDEQWSVAVDRLEAALGLSGQPRAVIAHVKNGRGHRHVIWSRIDLARGRAISDSFNFRKHEQTARELEREFILAPVQGAHVERQGKPRPTRTPSHAELQQSKRTGLSPQEAKATVTALWNRTATGKEFAAALSGTGWSLARGDRRDFCVIDPNGEAHSLARRVDGATAKNIRVRMADLDDARLPSVEEARVAMQQRQPKEPPRRTAEVVKFTREATRQGRRRQSGRGRPQRHAAGACPVPRHGAGAASKREKEPPGAGDEHRKDFGIGQGAEASYRGRACEERARASSPTKAPEANATPPPETDARAQLRRELDRWSLCRRFVYQFSLVAKPKPKPQPSSAKKWRGRHRRGGDGWRRHTPHRWRSTRSKARKLGLAAVKHQQQQAERIEQQGRAFVALAHVVADTGGGGFPEQMTRDLQACRTPQERQAWAVLWGRYLSGQAQRERRGAPERPAASGAAVTSSLSR